MDFLYALLGYGLGSIPFGLVITRLAGLGDIRNVGSGNIGATNVLRTGRKDLALATLLLDSGKGAIAVIIAGVLSEWRELPMALAGAFAFLGHCYPVWLKFKGGKGVATFLGTLLAMNLMAGAIACIVWLGAAFVTRISSLSALIAATIAPAFLFLTGRHVLGFAVLFMVVLIFIRHRENIARIMAGTEPRIGKKKPSESGR